MTRVRVPVDRLDRAVRAFRDDTLPAARVMPGFAGAILLVNRETGEAAAVTGWDSRAALDASEETAARLRAQTLQANAAGLVSVERWEVAVLERDGPRQPGAAVRTVRGRVPAAQLDLLAHLVRDTALGALRPLEGFRALALEVDRFSGHFALTSMWTTPAAREAGDAVMTDLHGRTLATAGAQDLEVLDYETVLVDAGRSATVS